MAEDACTHHGYLLQPRNSLKKLVADIFLLLLSKSRLWSAKQWSTIYYYHILYFIFASDSAYVLTISTVIWRSIWLSWRRILTCPCSISSSKFSFLITASWFLIVSEAFVSCCRNNSISSLPITCSVDGIFSTVGFIELPSTWKWDPRRQRHDGFERNLPCSGLESVQRGFENLCAIIQFGFQPTLLQSNLWNNHTASMTCTLDDMLKASSNLI